MRIGAIVQARTGSARVPNKVLYRVDEKPMLQYLLERLEHCHSLDSVVVATSIEAEDTAIAEFCQQYGVDCYRGSLANVASRFREVLEVYQFDGFIRVNGDSPLLDQRLVDKAVGIFQDGDFDLVTNILERTYPTGQSVEVVRSATFRTTYASMREVDELEHVTKYFYKHPEDFRIHNFSLPVNLNDIRLSVDTPQDMGRFANIISKMVRSHWEYTFEEVLQIYQGLNGEQA